MANERILECVLCRERYSVQDVKAGKYYPSTGICLACYEKALQGNKKIWCFGEFEPSVSECRAECPDRRPCKRFSMAYNSS